MSAKLLIVTASLSAGVLLAQIPALGQSEQRAEVSGAALQADSKAKGAKEKLIAQQFDRYARVLTVFDREGRVLSTIGDRAIYSQPVFSPNRRQLAVIKSDLGNETVNLWVFDVATGKALRITDNQTWTQEYVQSPVWSPDGSQLAYVALRDSYQGVYRRPSNGQGAEELLYRHSGEMALSDWSQDGRFLHFHSTDLSGGALYALPVDGDGPRLPVQLLRSVYQLRGAHVSPDGRFLAYQSDQSGRDEIYVRPFDATPSTGATSAEEQRQLSEGIQASPPFWRNDGRELYYVSADGGVMVTPVSTESGLQVGSAKLLFRLSRAVSINGRTASVSRDGQRVVVAVPHKPVLQQMTVFDRTGAVVREVGSLGRHGNLTFSPDGAVLAAESVDPWTGNSSIWTFDVASGKGTSFTDGRFLSSSPIWSPDGRELAYVSRRGSFSSIFRRALSGSGHEEHLFRYTPGASMVLTDWSADGTLMTFNDATAGVLHVLPLRLDQSTAERRATEWLRDEYNVAQARLSPDARFMAYLSNEFKSNEEIQGDIFEVYVRPFDVTESDVSSGDSKPVQVSTAGAIGMIFWRQDGRELFYLTPTWEVMAVAVTTSPRFSVGTPTVLFKLPGHLPLGGNPQQLNSVSRDGQRFAFSINVPVGIAVR